MERAIPAAKESEMESPLRWRLADAEEPERQVAKLRTFAPAQKAAV